MEKKNIYIYIYIFISLYTSDSEPGVRVPPGVRTRKFRGKRKKITNGGKKDTYVNSVRQDTSQNFEIN